MYAQLAKTNVRKSIKDYLIYFITITICVSLFYAITSLSSSSYELITEESYNFRNLKLILQYSTTPSSVQKKESTLCIPEDILYITTPLLTVPSVQ